MRPLVDTLLVARFEVLRALRTWRALALALVYLLASTGGAWIFTRVLLGFEQQAAMALGVPTTDVPGLMIDRVVKTDEFRMMVAGMVGDEQLVDQVLALPMLAMCHLWLGILLVPFLATSTAAECIAIDMGNRALRFELVRTGRLELVLGRLLGQSALTLVATLFSATGVFVVGMVGMLGNDPIELTLALGVVSSRAWLFGLPFLGIGVAASQITTSSAWARVLALGATAASWVVLGLLDFFRKKEFIPVVWDAVSPLLPQEWLRGLWVGGAELGASALVLTALGVGFSLVGYARMATRDV
jgi:hypothetical protein